MIKHGMVIRAKSKTVCALIGSLCFLTAQAHSQMCPDAEHAAVKYFKSKGVRFNSDFNSFDAQGSRISASDLDRIRDLPKLVSIDLSGIRLDKNSLKTLSELPHLFQLFISNCYVKDGYLTQLVNSENLGLLDLSRNPITDNGVKSICKIKNLQQLIASTTEISDKGARKIVEKFDRIVVDPRQLHLYLSPGERNNRIREESKWIYSIVFLDDEKKSINDTDLEPLGQLTNIKALIIKGAGDISDSGLATLAKISSLENLTIEEKQKFSGDGLKRLHGCKSLRFLCLHGEGIDRSAFFDLARQLPKCEIEWNQGRLNKKKAR